MSRNVDRALASLDAGLVLATAPATDASYEPYGTERTDLCWRCVKGAPDGPSGLCAACRTVLLDDEYVASEPDEETFRFGLTGWRVALQREEPPRIEGDYVDPPDARFRRAIEQLALVSGSSASDAAETMRTVLGASWSRAAADFAQAITRVWATVTADVSWITDALTRMGLELGPRKPPPVPAKQAHRRRYGR